MAETTKRRARRIQKRLERQRRAAVTVQRANVRGPDGPQPPLGGPDDLDGGAGVREPRRPLPGHPGGARALEIEDEEYVGLAR